VVLRTRACETLETEKEEKNLYVAASMGGLNGSTQHYLEVYSRESENLESFAGVDLNAMLFCPVLIEHSRTGRFS
jgi:hypothetical protein